MTDAPEQLTLAACTTLGLGGPAARLITAASPGELAGAVRAADQRGEPLLVLGGGSNTVVADEGFGGTVVKVACRGVRLSAAGDGQVLATVAAGESWDELTARCAAEGLAGLECLAGIPGLAGATPIQNVGAYGQEVAGTITTVAVWDRARGEHAELTAAQCGFGYRTSMFKREAGWRPPGVAAGGTPTGRYVILGVSFMLSRSPLSGPVRYAELARRLGVEAGQRVPLERARAAVLELRRGKGMVVDPADPDSRSAGSFFTNPVISAARLTELEQTARARFGPEVTVPRYPEPDGAAKVPAAWLIERAGFTKGYPDGAAVRISAKHTLALVNAGGGSTKELLALAAEIRDRVRAAFGITLVPEPVLVGVSL